MHAFTHVSTLLNWVLSDDKWWPLRIDCSDAWVRCLSSLWTNIRRLSTIITGTLCCSHSLLRQNIVLKSMDNYIQSYTTCIYMLLQWRRLEEKTSKPENRNISITSYGFDAFELMGPRASVLTSSSVHGAISSIRRLSLLRCPWCLEQFYILVPVPVGNTLLGVY